MSRPHPSQLPGTADLASYQSHCLHTNSLSLKPQGPRRPLGPLGARTHAHRHAHKTTHAHTHRYRHVYSQRHRETDRYTHARTHTEPPERGGKEPLTRKPLDLSVLVVPEGREGGRPGAQSGPVAYGGGAESVRPCHGNGQPRGTVGTKAQSY